MLRRRQRLAVHEAGHAVALLHYGLCFDYAWVGQPGTRGWTLATISQRSADSLALTYFPDQRAAVRIAMAGLAAEAVWGRRWPERRVRWTADWGRAVWHARYALTGDARLLVEKEEYEHPEYVAYIAPEREHILRFLVEPGTQRGLFAVADAIVSADGEVLPYARCAELTAGRR
jgi:hypothetical protein